MNKQCGAKRKYKLDESFFEKIDSEEKAYWLGLLYADGHWSKYQVSISLQEGDRDILEKMNNLLFEDKQLCVVKSKKNGMANTKAAYMIRINSIRISSDLKKLGLFAKKSSYLTFPSKEQVPNHLIRHFIRGYFDGDGCVGVYRKKDMIKNYIAISIIGSKEFNLGLLKVLEKQEVIKIKPYHSKKLDSSNMSLLQTSFSKALIFLDYIYSDSSIFMKRKKEKYLNFLEYER